MITEGLAQASSGGSVIGLENRRHERDTVALVAELEHLQARDLRRTAAVRLAEAGATVPEIAAVTGHSIDRTERIMEVYVPRTRAMAVAAIEKLERKR